VARWAGRNRLSRGLGAAQGAYYVATGVAPFLSRRAFEAVTGPKVDWWLVECVGLLVTPIGAMLLAGAREAGGPSERESWLAISTAAALAIQDVRLVALGRIRPTYLADAALQAVLIAGWAAVLAQPRDAGGGGSSPAQAG
jgi:hypothetical protein